MKSKILIIKADYYLDIGFFSWDMAGIPDLIHMPLNPI